MWHSLCVLHLRSSTLVRGEVLPVQNRHLVPVGLATHSFAVHCLPGLTGWWCWTPPTGAVTGLAAGPLAGGVTALVYRTLSWPVVWSAMDSSTLAPHSAGPVR